LHDVLLLQVGIEMRFKDDGYSTASHYAQAFFTVADVALLLNLALCVMLLQVGIEMKFKDAGYRHMAAVTHVPELSQVRGC
jgi:hypothetical protein